MQHGAMVPHRPSYRESLCGSGCTGYAANCTRTHGAMVPHRLSYRESLCGSGCTGYEANCTHALNGKWTNYYDSVSANIEIPR
jgi:hypothetical protein